MYFTDGTGSGAGSGNAANAAQGAEAGNAKPAANEAAASVQGADTSNLVSKSEFDTLTKKLDSVLSDNAKYRDRLRRLVADDDGEGKDGKSDKTAEKVEKMIAAARKDRFTSQITTASVKLGAPHPELVVAALSMDEVADDEGNIKNVDTVVADFKKRYPALFTTDSVHSINAGSGSGSGKPRTSADIDAEIRAFRRGNTIRVS